MSPAAPLVGSVTVKEAKQSFEKATIDRNLFGQVKNKKMIWFQS